MGFAVQDAALQVTKSMPASNTTAVSTGIDLGHGLKGDFLANMELQVSVDAMTTGQLGDAATHTFDIEHDTDPAFGTTAAIMKGVLVQTGAGGVGAAAAAASVRLPVDVKRYVRAKVTKSDNVNASAKNFYIKLLG